MNGRSGVLLLLPSPAIPLGFTILGKIFAYKTPPSSFFLIQPLRQPHSVFVDVPEFDSRLFGGDLSGSSHTSDYKIGTSVATLPGVWCYRISAGTGWPGVSRKFDLQLLAQCGSMHTCVNRSVPDILGRKASKQPTSITASGSGGFSFSFSFSSRWHRSARKGPYALRLVS